MIKCKIISLSLVLAMLFSLSLVTTLASPTESEPLEAENMAAKEAVVLGENVSLRTENAKAFDMSDGSIKYQVYPGSIHYEDALGNFQTIDTAVERAGTSLLKDAKLKDARYKVEKNPYSVYFKDISSDKPYLTMRKDDYSISMGLVSANSSQATVKNNAEAFLVETAAADYLGKAFNPLEFDESCVSYSGLDKGVHLLYKVEPDMLKEYIVLEQPLKSYEFPFTLSLENMTLDREGDIIQFKDKDGEVQFFISGLFMVDANGVECYDITFELEGGKSEYVYTLKPDEKWLNDPERAYPVVIDPTLSSAYPAGDAYVSSKNPNTNYASSNVLRTGYEVNLQNTRSYIQFNLPPIPRGYILSYANFYLYSYSKIGSVIVGVAQVDTSKAWNAANLTWGNQPNLNYSQTRYFLPADVGWNYIPIDWQWVDDWYTSANYGLGLTSYIENDIGLSNMYYSNEAAQNKPFLEIGCTSYAQKNVSVDLYADKSFRDYYSTWQTMALDYFDKAKHPFLETWNLNLTMTTSAPQQITYLPGTYCTVQIDKGCPFTSACGYSHEDHHWNAEKILSYANSLSGSGYHKVLLTAHYLCYVNNSDGFHNNAAGYASNPGRGVVTSVIPNFNTWRTVRAFQHELSHNYGCKHTNSGDACTSPCINNSQIDDSYFVISDIWCRRCKETFKKNY